jgi:hypothetical protein
MEPKGVQYTCRVGIKKWLSKAIILLVDYVKNSWNDLIKELKGWQEISLLPVDVI